MVATDELIPYANNSRTHSEKQVGQIAASMREFGWTLPIVVDEANTVLAGHGRLLAAKKLGLCECPVVRVSNLSAAQKKAYTIADNKIAENSGWDKELLNLELDFLHEQEFDLSLLGFKPVEINDLLGIEQAGKDESDQLARSYSIILDCTGEKHQLELLDEFEGRGIKCRALLRRPER